MMVFFWECTHHPLVQIREHPEFHDLIQRIRALGLVAYFGMVGLLPYLLWVLLSVGQLPWSCFE